MRRMRLFAGVLMVLGLMLVVQVSSAVAEVPVIDSITPSSGGNNSATGVTITGLNFEQGAEVSLFPGGPYIKGSVDTPGDAWDVYVSGSYAYVANGDSGLQVIDISTPSSPVIIGSVDILDWAVDVYVSGDYAYVAGGSSPYYYDDYYVGNLQVIDISTPSSPVIIGSVDTAGPASGVYVSGNYAYVTGGWAGLQVIDISTPSSPVIIGHVDIPDWTVDVYVSGSYAYVTGEMSGLQVIDISTPSSPVIIGHVEIGFFDIPNWAIDVYVSGSYAYVTGGGLQVIDISTPFSPVIIGSVGTPGYAIGVYVSGSYAYVTGEMSGLQVIDISIPSSSAIIGSVGTPGWAVDVYVSGSYAYVTGRGLQVIDISTPSSPVIIGSVDTPSWPYGVYVSGSYAYVADRNSGLQVIDISTPSSPAIIGSVDTPGWAEGVYVSGSYAYVAGGSGLQVIDISDPSSPVIIGSVDIPDRGRGTDVHISGSYAYVAGGSDLHVIDISTPSSPAIIGHIQIGFVDIPDRGTDVHISGSYAYVAGGSKLHVIDISTPSSPVIIGFVDTPGYAYDVYVSGSYAYVAGGYSPYYDFYDYVGSLQVIDIRTPSSPVIIGSVYTAGPASGVYVSGSYAYVAGGYSGLQVMTPIPVLLDSNVGNSTTITAAIPADLPDDAYYNIIVSNPGGEVGTLPNGYYRVLDGVVVDNTDPGFSVQGTWGIRSDNVVPGVYGKSFHFIAPGDGSDTAAWDAELVEGAGNYEVFVWYPAYSGLAANALFTINHAGISDTLIVDQGINGGQWVSLGIYEFVNNGTENITLSDKADSWVAADAVKFEPTDLPPSTPPTVPPSDGIIDNTDEGFRVEGTWPSCACIPNFFGEDLRHHAAGDGTDTAAWDAELVDGAGNYEVFVWYPVYSGLASDAEYIINHANGSDTVLIDQGINGASWISLGVYEFTNEGGGNITLTDNANGFVIADAVKFVLPDGIADNADSGFSVVGVWKTYNAAPRISGYGKDLRYHAAGDGTETAAWEAELVDGPGSYEVSVWYPVSSHLAANTPYTINHAGGSDTVLVDQSVNGGQWVSLGLFDFTDDGTEDVTISDNADSWVAADAVRFSPVSIK